MKCTYELDKTILNKRRKVHNRQQKHDYIYIYIYTHPYFLSLELILPNS